MVPLDTFLRHLSHGVIHAKCDRVSTREMDCAIKALHNDKSMQKIHFYCGKWCVW
jgi:hypothetical protein